MLGEDGRMIDRIPLFALLALASLPAAAASNASRNYGVNGFERIRIDGPYEVRVHTGVAPYAKASAKNLAALDALSVKVDGKTLIIRRNSSSWGGYEGQSTGLVVIDVGTHDLSTVWQNGSGSVVIDKAKGLMFDLFVQGAGMARVDQMEVDQLRLNIDGASTTRLSGKALKVNANARGSVNLDASGLAVKDAIVTAEGPSLVRMQVSDTAKVNAYGIASVDLGGGAACTIKAPGSATVTGCKSSD